MLLERFEVKGLAHYSYALGCTDSRKLVFIDPKRDIDTYLDFARQAGYAIAGVLETHIHADFASGARQLAHDAAAPLHVSAYDQGETFEVRHPHFDLRDGQRIELGKLRITAMHTPGHTPEHVSFLVAREGDAAPVAMFSGDFLFVGSVGRPDLLGEGATLSLADALYRSVQTMLAKLPDSLAVYPAHGAGSLCGAGMAGAASSTLGQERLSNPYLEPGLSRETFVERLLGSTPPFPPYYRRMKRLNADGPPALEPDLGQRAIAPEEFSALVESGYTVIDLRGQADFGAGHISGAFGIGLGNLLSVWSSWVVPYETPLLLVTPDPSMLDDAVRCLTRVGLDDVRGYLEGGIAAWVSKGLATRKLPQTPPQQLFARIQSAEDVRVLDVRSAAEFASGHIQGAVNILVGELPQRVAEAPRDADLLAITCGGGYRSTVAASILERAGFTNVANVPGGMGAWRQCGLPVV